MLMKYTRVVYTAVLIVVIYCVFGLVIAEQAFASVNQVERSEDELLILEVHVNGTVRNRGLIGYLPQGQDLAQTFLPISSLSRTLSFAIRANPVEGMAEGWFREEKNIFQLDLNRNVVFVNGKEIALPEGGAEAHFEDIYVQAALLQDWFGVQIKPDVSTLRLFVTRDTLFPFEEDLARRERGQGIGHRKNGEKASYDPDTLLPYQWFSKPSIVWQNSVQGRKDSGGKSGYADFSLQANLDALKFGAKFVISGSHGTEQEPRINNAQLSFQKRDPGNELLGPLKAGKVAFGDVSYPDVPLIVGRKRGRGVAVSSDSNFNIAQSFGPEQYDVDGDAPIGWDAELYRNGYFVAFQEVGENGRYNFEDVELVRGFNMFQIVLYGPEGQKRTETQRIVRGQEMLRKGELNYDFAAGQPDTDFLPITDNSDTNSTFGGSGRVFYGIKDYLTVGGSVFTGLDESGDDDDDRLSAASISAVTAFLGLKTQVQFMGANEGRSGYSIETTTRALGANMTVGHRAFNGFSAEDKDLVSTTSIDANKNLGFMSANISAEKNKYQKKEDELVLRGDLSTRLAGVRLSNTLERTFSDNEGQEEFDGKLSLLTNFWGTRLRSNLLYDLDSNANEKLQNMDISLIKGLSSNSTLRLNGSYDFSSHIKTADLRYSREFENYSVDLNIGGSTEDTRFVGVTFRTGLQPDDRGHYRMVSARDGGAGSVGLRAYLDKNGDHVYDEGDELLQYVSFRSNRGVIDGETDEEGALFVNGLSEGLTRFALNDGSLPSIYIKPYEDYIDIIPRSGATTTIDVGFEQLGEIDGFVFAQVQAEGDKKKPVPGLDILLIDADTGTEISAGSSEYDGYYIFSAIPLGRYIVKVLPFWDGEGDSLPSLEIELNGDNPIATDRNIIVPAMQEVAEIDSLALDGVEPASGTDYTGNNDGGAKEQAPKIAHVIDDEPLPVVTDGLDIATGEPLRGLFVHVGSVETFDVARTEQKRLWSKHPDILGDIPLYIYKIKVGERTYHRIVGVIKGYAQGNKICDALVSQDAVGGCILVEL